MRFYKQCVFILQSQEFNFKSSFFVLLMINKSLACRLPIPITVGVCILPKCVRGCWHLITRIFHWFSQRKGSLQGTHASQQRKTVGLKKQRKQHGFNSFSTFVEPNSERMLPRPFGWVAINVLECNAT